ncbi:MAG TPA: hypothetical protein VE640_05060, partial [Candidatus Bathyarchaeia archaeon]|nr:hypothetical protein [Candidatus Bathyarchaeia archaeon]
MAYRYLLESGQPDGYLLEDSSGVLSLDGDAPLSPRLITTVETAWNTSADKTTASFAVLKGDILVAWMSDEGYDTGSGNTSQALGIANTGSLSAWNQEQLVQVNLYCQMAMWTATATADGNVTVTFSHAGASIQHTGGRVWVFRDSDGVGASAKTNVASGAPSLAITTNRDNSALCVGDADFLVASGYARAWRTGSGELVENTFQEDTGHYTVYGGHHRHAGLAGSNTVGLTAPGGQKYSIIAVEVYGRPGTVTTQFVEPGRRTQPGIRRRIEFA